MAAFSTIATLGLMAGSTALSAYSAHKQGDAAKKAAKATSEAAESQAQVYDFNAAVAELQSADAIERGAEAEAKFRQQIRATIGSQRAALAGGNIDVSFGTAADVQADAAYLGELDALTIRTNAKREAWGYQVQAANYQKQAEVTRKAGDQAIATGAAQASAANWQAAGTLLTGGASLLQAKYSMGK